MDRGSHRAWLEGGSNDTFARARSRVDALLAESVPSSLDPVRGDELVGRVAAALRAIGFGELPGVTAERADRAMARG